MSRLKEVLWVDYDSYHTHALKFVKTTAQTMSALTIQLYQKNKR